MVKYISDRIGVMNYGRMLEIGPADEVYTKPLHDYTISLLSAVPIPDPEVERSRKQIAYEPTMEGNDKPRKMVEIAPHHYVRAAEDEVVMYQERAEKAGLEVL